MDFTSISSAWNIEIMNVDQFIRTNRCFEVTSPFAHQPSSNNFDEDGLFSERIFGEVASQTRLIKHGWIRLNCHVFHPIIFQNLQSLKRFYVEIMSGRSYAIWNPELRDFERASEDEEGAQTGYSFFLHYFDRIQFNKNQSLKRNDKINILVKYRDRLFIDKCLVAPAGIRDMREEDGMVEKDSINSLYLSLMQNAKAMPPDGDNDSIYDVTHYAIQRKVVEIYEYLMNFISDKRGFLASRLGARSVAQGTRNVITATSLECAEPSSPQFHKVEEIKVPLFQAAKGFSSLVAYQIKSAFYAPIIQSGQDQVPLINPESLSLEYVGINDKDKDYLLTTEGILKTIDRFRDPAFRFRPVTALTQSGKRYYLYMVYEDGDKINIFRNVEEFKLIMRNIGQEVDPLRIRPLTYAELIYIATTVASWGKSGTLTRYPIESETNIFPGLTHVMSTVPGRIVKLIRSVEAGTFIELPEYPTIGGRFVDAVMIHPSRLKGLGADFDGNCLSGSTTIQIRFTPLWLAMIEELDYTISGQSAKRIVEALKRDSFVYRVGTYETIYTTVRFDEMPQPGSYTVDKNGARVFDLPPGCDVLSMKDGSPRWLPFTNITVEDDCEYRRIVVGNHSAEVSTNPSVAVFDTKSGELIKVTPKDAEGKFAPAIVKDMTPYGMFGNYYDGWLLGVMVSDGYLEQKYLGYTKLDSGSRSCVIRYFKSLFGNDILYKEYAESSSTGANKLGNSVSIHFTDPRIRSWASSLDMYDSDIRTALTKRISPNFIANGSRDFLVGALAGLFDGDGSIVIDNKGLVSFRLSTSSKSLVESVRYLAYRLGIRTGVTTVPPRGWSKESYVVMFRASDMLGVRDELICQSQDNISKLNYWATRDIKPKDLIPLSEKERDHMVKVVTKHGSKAEADYFKYQDLDTGFTRTMFFKFLPYIEMASILRRVKYWSVQWSKVRLDGEPTKGTVYDLLVPDSKVFAVNNGLIVYDTISWIPLFSDEASKQCKEYYNSKGNYINTDGSPTVATDDLCAITAHALTMEPKEGLEI